MKYPKGYDKNADYCSYSPDNLFGIKLSYGCYCHDRQYRNEVRLRKTRKQADQGLRNFIYNAFKQKDKRFIGLIVSNIYYFFVRSFGGKEWMIDKLHTKK